MNAEIIYLGQSMARHLTNTDQGGSVQHNGFEFVFCFLLPIALQRSNETHSIEMSCIEALAFTQSPYIPFERAPTFLLLHKSPMSFHFWHLVCKNNLDNYKGAQFISGKIHAGLFLHSTTFMQIRVIFPVNQSGYTKHLGEKQSAFFLAI